MTCRSDITWIITHWSRKHCSWYIQQSDLSMNGSHCRIDWFASIMTTNTDMTCCTGICNVHIRCLCWLPCKLAPPPVPPYERWQPTQSESVVRWLLFDRLLLLFPSVYGEFCLAGFASRYSIASMILHPTALHPTSCIWIQLSRFCRLRWHWHQRTNYHNNSWHLS